MSTRVVLDGRVMFQSRDWRAFKPSDPELNPQPDASGKLAVQGSYRREVPRLGTAITDADDGVTYRVVAVLDVHEGWVTAATLRRWYHEVPFPQIVRWVHAGVLDAAMEAGSPTKKFRVRKPEVCDAYRGRR